MSDLQRGAATPDPEVQPLLGKLTQEIYDERRAAHDAQRPHAVAQQRKLGKLTARERIQLLVDPGSFDEIGILARPSSDTELMDGVSAPGDGIIIGRAHVHGRPIVTVSYDFTVLGGSMGRINDEKFARARQISLRSGVPLVMFVEGGGARINERMGSTTMRGHERFSDLSLLSGWAPIVSAIVGPSYAGHANLVALSDFAVMVEGTSAGMAGPLLVEKATGERVTAEELGGMELHARVLGSVELDVATEADAVDAIKRYLSYFPSNSSLRPPHHPYARLDERLPDSVYSLVPDNPNRAYDMRRLVRVILDPDSEFEIKPRFARNLITTLGRIGGHVVGVIANNPMFLAGTLDTPASDKMARFINICDAFNIPLVILCDVPGYLVGRQAEATNIVRHSMKPLWELGQSTVPLMTVVIRKAYGLAYHTMGGAEFHPDLMVCWPSAQVSPMGAEGAVNVILAKRPDVPEEERIALIGAFKALESPLVAARAFKVDDVIDPCDTRKALLETLQWINESDRDSGHWRPPKKRGISPA